jgi:hypothetical protein
VLITINSQKKLTSEHCKGFSRHCNVQLKVRLSYLSRGVAGGWSPLWGSRPCGQARPTAASSAPVPAGRSANATTNVTCTTLQLHALCTTEGKGISMPWENRKYHAFLTSVRGDKWVGVAQSEKWLTTDWTTGVRSPTEAEDFSSSFCIQTGSEAYPASCTMGTRGSFPGSKARPGRDADHSPPSSAEVKNE